LKKTGFAKKIGLAKKQINIGFEKLKRDRLCKNQKRQA